MTDSATEIRNLCRRVRELEAALRFYAKHEHWMQIAESAETSRVLIAHGCADGGDGWAEAEAALASIAERPGGDGVDAPRPDPSVRSRPPAGHTTPESSSLPLGTSRPKGRGNPAKEAQ